MKESDREIAEAERKRVDALNRRDAAAYFVLCEQLGVLPELPDLYDQGKDERGMVELSERDMAATTDFTRRVYAETEKLGVTIARAFDLAGSKLHTASIRCSVDPIGRGSEGGDYVFRANVTLGTLEERFTHPYRLHVSHEDARGLDTELKEYEAQCVAEITDAIDRQSQGRLIVEPSEFVGLAVRRRA